MKERPIKAAADEIAASVIGTDWDYVDVNDLSHTVSLVLEKHFAQKPYCETKKTSLIPSVFAHYRTYHPRACPDPKVTTKEWKLINSRMLEGFTTDDLKTAIDGCHMSPFHMGENKDQRKYNSLELIMRDASKVNQFIELAGLGNSPVVSEKSSRNHRAVEQFKQRARGNAHDGANTNGLDGQGNGRVCGPDRETGGGAE